LHSERTTERDVLRDVFGAGAPSLCARAPGRVNVIGEHTDYNLGRVLPFAIAQSTVVEIRPRRDLKVRVFSNTLRESAEMNLPIIAGRRSGTWRDYVAGVLAEFGRLAQLSHGFDATIHSDVPIGAGLSSSAALEVAISLAVCRLYQIDLEDLEVIRLCQRAESTSVGTECGLMDQYASLLGEADRILEIDLKGMTHRSVAAPPDGYRFLVVDSGVRRALSSSHYNTRRGECQEALERLRSELCDPGSEALADLSRGELDRAGPRLPPHLRNRAMHVIEENERVRQAASTLERGDMAALGELIYSSHVSQRDLYEVSVPEVDEIVEWGCRHGALGARIMGGGFGGATLHLVPSHNVSSFCERILGDSLRRYGVELSVWEVQPSAGAGAVDGTR